MPFKRISNDTARPYSHLPSKEGDKVVCRRNFPIKYTACTAILPKQCSLEPSMSAVSYPRYLEAASPELIPHKWLFNNRYGQSFPMPCPVQPFGHHLSVRLTRALAPFIFLRFCTPIFRPSASHRRLQVTELPARIAIMDRSHEFYQLLQSDPVEGAVSDKNDHQYTDCIKKKSQILQLLLFGASIIFFITNGCWIWAYNERSQAQSAASVDHDYCTFTALCLPLLVLPLQMKTNIFSSHSNQSSHNPHVLGNNFQQRRQSDGRLTLSVSLST